MENNTGKPYAIGIDIGGTNTVFGLVDAQGNVLSHNGFKTKDYPDINRYADTLGTHLLQLVETAGGRKNIRGIGVGAPNANYYTGCIEQAPNLPWKGIVPLADMLRERTGIAVSMTNDANAAALGEMTYGAARGMKDFIMITLGTGVGSGIIINGQLVYGHDGLAGELGHVIVRPGGRLCGCGRRGCLETYCSATGIVRTVHEVLTSTDEPSRLRRIPLEQVTSKDIYDAAEQSDRLALEIFRFTGTILGEAFANFIAFSGPEAIVLFGGLAKAGHYIIDPIREAMEANVMNIYKGKTRLLVSQLKDSDAAILGAGALGWEAV